MAQSSEVKGGVSESHALYLRKNAEAILRSQDVLYPCVANEPLPVAVLGSFIYQENGAGVTVFPRKIFSPVYVPVLIIDLEDLVWPHAIELIRGISQASGIPATEEDLRQSGHSRHILQWMKSEINALDQPKLIANS